MTKFAISFKEAVEFSGIGRSSLYKAVNRGEIRLKKSGRRSLILVDDLKAWLNELPDASKGGSA